MSEPIKAVGRVEWQAFLILALVFGAGGALGVAFERVREPGPPPEREGPPPGGPRPGENPGEPPRPPEPRTRAESLRVPRYFEQLNPTDSQRLAIRTLLEAQRPKADSAMATVLPRLRAITDSTFEAIGRLLTPEQRKRYDATKPQRALVPMPGNRMGGPPGMRGGGGPPPDGMGPPRDGDRRRPPPDGMGPPPGEPPRRRPGGLPGPP